MTYVFFSNNISGIGGEQQYILRKARFLRNNGYKVLFVVGNATSILLDELSTFRTIQIPEITLPFFYYPKCRVEKVFHLITSFIAKFKNSDLMLFESTTISNATWAELIAGYFNARSFVYEINGFPIKDPVIADFASFKLNRNELIGCSKNLCKMLFTNFPNLYDDHLNLYVNIPFNNSELTEDHTIAVKKNKNRNRIGILTVSRIEKGYLPYLIDEVKSVASIISNRKFTLTLVLSKRQGVEFNILRKKARNLPSNMSVTFLGPITPLPKSLFMDNDIFVGMGTSALSAISLGMPAIIASFESNLSAGILGVDIDDFGYFQNYNDSISFNILRLIKDENFMQEVRKKSIEFFRKEYYAPNVMKEFMSLITANIDKSIDQKYYEFRDIVLSPRSYIRKLILLIIGTKGYKKLVKCKGIISKLIDSIK